jgi:hypothetical protein
MALTEMVDCTRVEFRWRRAQHGSALANTMSLEQILICVKALELEGTRQNDDSSGTRTLVSVQQ